MTVRALVVGAGAVGQTYGRHLQRGGAQLSFLVKGRYAEEARHGYVLYPLNRKRARRAEAEPLEGFGVHTLDALEAGELEAGRFDQVWLAVPSTAIRAAWLGQLVASLGDATLVSLVPGLEDCALLLEAGVRAEQLVQGIITPIAWQAPLPGEDHWMRGAPGVAYWFPPLAPSPFAGPSQRVRAVVEVLRRGGMPAKVRADVGFAGYAEAVLIPQLVALEAAGWRFAPYRAERETLALACRANQQALRVVAAYHGAPRPPLGARLLARPSMLRWGTRLAPHFVPFDLETYLGYHFTKVGPQTRQMLSTYTAQGRARDLPVDAIEALLALAGG